MSLPAHVASVEMRHVRLGGDCRELLPILRNGPYAERLFRDEHLRPCLRRASDDNPLTDLDLAALLGYLAEQGVAFLELMDRPYGPAELMRALQADGNVADFDSLLVRSPDDWERVPYRR